MTTAIMFAALNGFAISVPLAVAVWIVLRISRRWLNAATRYGVWWIALAAVVAIPLLFLPVRRAQRAPITPVIRSFPAAAPAVADTPPPVEHAFLPGPAHAGRLWPVTLHSGIWSARFVQLWVLAAILMGLRLVVSYAVLHRRKTRATDAGDRCAMFVETSLARLGTRRRVRVAVVDDAVSPMVAGPLRPSVSCCLPRCWRRCRMLRSSKSVCTRRRTSRDTTIGRFLYSG